MSSYVLDQKSSTVGCDPEWGGKGTAAGREIIFRLFLFLYISEKRRSHKSIILFFKDAFNNLFNSYNIESLR
jgi:hypothetical protein